MFVLAPFVSQESGLLGPCKGVFPSLLGAVAAIDVAVSETAVDIVITTLNASLRCCQVCCWTEEGGEVGISVGELGFNP